MNVKQAKQSLGITNRATFFKSVYDKIRPREYNLYKLGFNHYFAVPISRDGIKWYLGYSKEQPSKGFIVPKRDFFDFFRK